MPESVLAVGDRRPTQVGLTKAPLSLSCSAFVLRVEPLKSGQDRRLSCWPVIPTELEKHSVKQPVN